MGLNLKRMDFKINIVLIERATRYILKSKHEYEELDDHKIPWNNYYIQYK